MMKSSNFLRVSLIGLCIFASVPLSYSDPVKVGNLYYEIDGGAQTAALAYSETYQSLTTLYVPGTVEVGNVSYTVTAVAQQAFHDCVSLSEVKFADGVKEIGNWAFYRCYGLEKLELPSTLVSIGQSAFSKCSALPELVLPDNVTTIGSFGFGTCTSLTQVVLSKSLKVLSGNVFDGCTNLSSVDFGTGIEVIEENAFYNCGFTEISGMPSNVRRIDSGVFSNCMKLKKVSFPATLTDIGDFSFYKCKALTDVEFPESLQHVGSAAFYECELLRAIDLPASIASVSSNAFYGCASVKSVKWPDSLTEIEPGMFHNCSGLESIEVPATVTSIGAEAFSGCTSLGAIELPKGLAILSKAVFNNCSSLKSIEIPSGVTSIEDNAFYKSGLTRLDIPASVTAIGDAVVLGCPSLQGIYVADGNPAYTDVDGVLMTIDGSVLLAYPGGVRGEYVMPDAVTAIAGWSCQQNDNITGIKFSKNLKSIGPAAFYMCNGLTELDFPQGMESIGDNAFFFSSNIKSIKLPNNDIFIGSNAFSATGVENLVFPEGIRSIGINGDQTYSVATMNSGLKWVSLPSSLTAMSPFGMSSANLKVIYCFAVEPPVLRGEYVADISAVVKVPKGSADAYSKAWKELYPNLTFEDVLPTGVSVTIESAGVASLGWEVYKDDVYTGVPVRYTVALARDGKTVSEDEISGEAAVGDKLSYKFTGLEKGGYSYELKGYSALGQLTLNHAGKFEIEQAGIPGISMGNAVVAVAYYDLFGRRIDSPVAGTLCIAKRTYADGTVSVTKELIP